ncbi:MAG: glycine zipper 2TM domain-containing protein [Sulfuricurvum sp.]|uniref:glycine zipper 2TM domain-containing protein n=1 Tax=Sulfuricurvum sp. TaxID=2025608 RepID=UPI0026130F60|nr:glycine zipper 2TM domain-containing protein [Sulfuricurvum sp.]MDD2828341.1 glycine zipper 2TM domain-containing protein [Sulfuricurvum sp.]MDD4949346.1 glycine zipper 2TM domain-containing protein [Sulfuricurvum sp.]
MKKVFISISLVLSTSILMAQSGGYGTSPSDTIISDIEYVSVTRSEPIYSTVSKKIPHEVCEDQQVAVQEQGGNSNVVGGLVGAALGGVLGHQLGGGSGKVATTIGGAAIGTMLGQNADRPTQTNYQTVRRCYTQYDMQTDNVITGYMNYAKYRGRDIAKTSSQPLKEIKVTNSFSF